MGDGRLIAPRTIAVALQGGGTQVFTADRVYLNVGTRAAIPDTPGLGQSGPPTHVEALDLDHVPDHLIVLGSGYIGLEFAQPMRRFGSRQGCRGPVSRPGITWRSDATSRDSTSTNSMFAGHWHKQIQTD